MRQIWLVTILLTLTMGTPSYSADPLPDPDAVRAVDFNKWCATAESRAEQCMAYRQGIAGALRQLAKAKVIDLCPDEYKTGTIVELFNASREAGFHKILTPTELYTDLLRASWACRREDGI